MALAEALPLPLAPPAPPRLVEAGALVRPIVWAGERTLPLHASVEGLFPDGALRRGSTLAASGSTSLLLRVLSAASRSGAWCAVVGVPTLGFAAAAELGVDLQHLLHVASPGSQWASVAAALLDALDVVVLEVPRSVAAHDARRLSARARERGAVLVLAGAVASWVDRVDLHLSCEALRWEGLQEGHGRLRRCHAQVAARGRGAASRERQSALVLGDA